ncbi:membrane protein [Jeongeupia sp. HS-3]|nr:DedA family protein [Jeongeupia sp. HS-3]BCL74519.1 membrane protein [Jeongeupia sp. HS-3]
MDGWWLPGLFASAFLSATLLPGNSEAALAAYLYQAPQHWLLAVLIATLGNSLGGVVTVWMGRRLPRKELPARAAWLKRWGPLALVLSWVPVAGDALCAGAGWLRWPWRQVLPWLVIGKLLRYLALVPLVRAATGH